MKPSKQAKSPFRLFRNERHPLLAVAGLVGFSLIVVGVSSFTGVGRMAPRDLEIVDARRIVVIDEADGAVAIYDAETKELVDRYASGEGGFARTAIRALAYTRRASEISSAAPLVVARDVNGRLYLDDPETGRRIDLGAFGAANEAPFQALIGADRRAS